MVREPTIDSIQKKASRNWRDLFDEITGVGDSDPDGYAHGVVHIVSDPKIMMGKPVVEGTRIPVELILEKLGAGESVAQILEAHPRLTEEGVRAALTFAAKVMRADVVYPSNEDAA